ncbi:MAG: hypothetical protein RIB93_22195 [Coleofasciculus sp. D1-CHI-01]|uniref:hypothetical protein n=1 Tax=Coleofasciculus sp. D1-CHI-01 TaxID=3068482 RepID=UPI0032FA362B
MYSNSPINPSMQNPPTDRYTPSTPVNNYCPSVPISVYRELAAELQAAQAMLDSLNGQNKQLVKQNQKLRQEVEKVLQSSQHLQQVVDSLTPVTGVEMPRRQSIPSESHPMPSIPKSPKSPKSAPSRVGVEVPLPHPRLDPLSSPYRESFVIEQEDSRSRRTSASESHREVNGWFLVLAIVLIVLSAFGAGFLIVRPLLNNNR